MIDRNHTLFQSSMVGGANQLYFARGTDLLFCLQQRVSLLGKKCVSSLRQLLSQKKSKFPKLHEAQHVAKLNDKFLTGRST